jgi:hypothetical protein
MRLWKKRCREVNPKIPSQLEDKLGQSCGAFETTMIYVILGIECKNYASVIRINFNLVRSLPKPFKQGNEQE